MSTRIGIVQLTGCSYELAYDLLSQDVATNSSTVRLYGMLHVTNAEIRWDSGSASVHTSGLQPIGNYYTTGDYILIQRDFTWTHDNNGNFSEYVGASLSTTFVSGDCGGICTLPKIDRFAIMTGATANPTDESTFYFTYSNPRNLTIEAWLEVNPVGEHIAERTITNAGTSGTYTWELTETERNKLRSNLPNSKTGTLRIGIKSTIGQTSQASYRDRTFTIVNANPTFNEAYEDTDLVTLAITNNNQQIIRNNSTLQINLSSMTALKYATLSTAKATINGTTYNGTISGTTCRINVGTLNIANNTTASIVVTDSRGYSTTHQLPIIILDWENPTGDITLARQSNYYSETDITVDGNYSSLDNKNEMTIKVRYKKTSDGSYGAYTTLQDNVTSVLTLDNLYAWNVQVLVEDKLGSTTYNLYVGIGLPIFYIDRLKRSIGIDCFPQDNSSLEINNINIRNAISGNLLWINDYPNNSFVEQTITLVDNLSNYNSYEIIYKQANNVNRFFTTGRIPVGMPTGMYFHSSYLTYRVLSESNIMTNDTILIGAGKKVTTLGSSTDDNSLLIPIYVLAYKTGNYA